MIHFLIVLAFPVVTCASGPIPASGVTVPVADSLREVYGAGQNWVTFYDAVDRRRELWTETWEGAEVPDELIARARSVGSWRILVITEPGCSDSANSVPYIAKLVAQVPGLELRLVNSTVGRPWMEAHRTTDGRAATPTVLILDEEYRIRGCWIEQPVALQAFWLPVVARGSMAEEVGEKLAWYSRDEGRETLREIIEVMEGAYRGEIACPG